METRVGMALLAITLLEGCTRSREQSSTQAGRTKSAGHYALVYLSEMYTRSSGSTGPSLFHMVKQTKPSTDGYCPLRQFKQEHFRTPLQHISS
jgi:hypothetical protein